MVEEVLSTKGPTGPLGPPKETDFWSQGETFFKLVSRVKQYKCLIGFLSEKLGKSRVKLGCKSRHE